VAGDGYCWLFAADKDTQSIMEPHCRLDCKSLSTKDYTDLLWTTVAEFPGNLLCPDSFNLYFSVGIGHIARTYTHLTALFP